MDTADRIEVAYESNTSDHLDLAQGIMAQRKSIVKGRRRKNLRYSAIVRRIYVRAGVFAALSILLAAMMCINIAVGVRIQPFHIVVLTLEAGYTLFLLWCALTLHSQQRKLMRGYAQPHPGGRLVFDRYGIEDASSDGRSMRLPWEEYELCVITPEVLVLAMGSIMFFVPAAPQTVSRVIDVLTRSGRAGSIRDLRG